MFIIIIHVLWLTCTIHKSLCFMEFVIATLLKKSKYYMQSFSQCLRKYLSQICLNNSFKFEFSSYFKLFCLDTDTFSNFNQILSNLWEGKWDNW